jgi:hypothetical protein
VHFVHGGEALSRKSVSDAHKSRPEPAVDQADPSTFKVMIDDMV